MKTFKHLPRRKIKTVVKGIFSTSISFESRVSSVDWTPYMPVYENQKWVQYDSDDCWCLSSVQNATFQLNYLLAHNKFSSEALTFFIDNKYIVNGTFQLSELHHEILCGNLNNGGTSEEAWQSFASRGFIPRSMLNYSEAMANDDATLDVFITEYYDKSRVTPAMVTLAKQFLQYVTIQSLSINPNSINHYLQQSPINIGIPVDPNLWNQVNVPKNTNKNICHEVVYYKFNVDGSLPINDQYQPNPKVLGAGYYVGVATLGVINAVQPIIATPIVSVANASYWAKFWVNVLAWGQGKALPYPNVQIGGKI